MKKIKIGRFVFKCDDVVNGVAINPLLPKNFDSTPNESRDDRSRAWWNVPFIRIENFDSADFKAHWPHGRFDVRCLDGGAWDRSTAWAAFKTLDAAIKSISHYRGTFLQDEDFPINSGKKIVCFAPLQKDQLDYMITEQ